MNRSGGKKKRKLFYVIDERSLTQAKGGSAAGKILFDPKYADSWSPIQAIDPRSAARDFAVRLGFGEGNYERLTLYVRQESAAGTPWKILRIVVEVTITVRYRISAGVKVVRSPH